MAASFFRASAERFFAAIFATIRCPALLQLKPFTGSMQHRKSANVRLSITYLRDPPKSGSSSETLADTAASIESQPNKRKNLSGCTRDLGDGNETAPGGSAPVIARVSDGGGAV